MNSILQNRHQLAPNKISFIQTTHETVFNEIIRLSCRKYRLMIHRHHETWRGQFADFTENRN